MADRQQQAERENTVGHGTFLLFLGWLVLMTALCVLYFVIGVLDV